MNLGVFVRNKLCKGIRIRILKDEQLSLSASLHDCLRLIGIQKNGILIASVEVFPLIKRIRRIRTVVVVHRVFRFVIGRDGIIRRKRIIHLGIGRSAKIVTQNLAFPRSDRVGRTLLSPLSMLNNSRMHQGL